MDRSSFIKGAGLGGLALAFPGLIGADAAFAQASPNDRIALWIVVNEAATPQGSVRPVIAWVGCVTFKPEQRVVKGGGNFTIVDFAKAPAARVPPIASGMWRATQFVNWDTKGLPTVGQIQPGVLDLGITMDGLGAATCRFACNVGFVGLMTGEPETTVLTTTQYGKFDKIVASLTHSSVPGNSTEVTVTKVKKVKAKCPPKKKKKR